MHTQGRLNKILKERGLTQSKVSEQTGIPQGTISRFDRNIRHETTILLTLARFLNVHIEDLFEVTDDEEHNERPPDPSLMGSI